MRCHGLLQRPLRDIIKSIGRAEGTDAITNSSLSLLPSTRSSCSLRKQLAPTPTSRLSARQSRHRQYGPNCERLPARCVYRLEGWSAASGRSARAYSTTAIAPIEENAEGEAVLTRSYHRQPRIKSSSDFNTRYFDRLQQELARERRKAQHRWSRYSPVHADDWKPILHALDQSVSNNQPDRYKKRTDIVRLPAGVVASFVDDPRAAILEVMQRTGCHIQIPVELDAGTAEQFTALALHGSPQQTRMAWNLLPRLVKVVTEGTQGLDKLKRRDLRREIDTTNASDTNLRPRDADSDAAAIADPTSAPVDKNLDAPIRSVWAEARAVQTRALPVRGAMSSILDVSSYVSDLIKPSARLVRPRRSREKDQPSTENPSERIVAELVDLFAQENIPKLAAPEAVDQALQFTLKHSGLRAYWKIYDSLESGRYKFTASNFNVLLAATARDGDVENFAKTVQFMLKRRRTPDSKTWACFYELMHQRFPAHTSTVLKVMRFRGVLHDNRAMKEIVKSDAPGELGRHIFNGGNIDSFFTAFEIRVKNVYGRPGFKWLHQDVLNPLLKILLMYGQNQDALVALEKFGREAKSGARDIVTLNTFLQAARRDEDAEFAVSILKHFRIGVAGAIRPDEAAVNNLFSIAWNRRYFNMLRVIWRYACVYGVVTYQMEQRMRQSLLAFSPTASVNNGDLRRSLVWIAFAAKFAVGVSYDLMPVPSKSLQAREDRGLPGPQLRILELAKDPPVEKGTKNSAARYSELLQYKTRDLEEACNCKPIVPFMDILERAWQKDLRWKERNLGLPKGLPLQWEGGDVFREMILHGIQTPMRPGNFTAVRREEVPWQLNRTHPEPSTSDSTEEGSGDGEEKTVEGEERLTA